MKIINQPVILILFLLFGMLSNAQEIEINGKVIADGESDVEWIHVINKTAKKFTITDQNGNFLIPAKLNDTIIISSIKYIREEIMVDNIIMHSKLMSVYLKENINQLNEVIVGKFLTGYLQSDILNTKIKDEINFYDVGIPGYTGRQMTQNERRLYDADYGKYFPSITSVNVYKILNKISGRTKKLKNIVRLDRIKDCIEHVKIEFSEILFEDLEYEEHKKMQFFYYVSDDPKFLELCRSDYSINMLEFLTEKLINYKNNLSENED